MRIAVLGVGLIGGSIGLAVRRRLDADVTGFDPDRELLGRAEELGAIGAAAESVAAAVQGAELVVCAAPVTALPGLAAEALDAASDDCAVTDVGSVKREVIAALGSDTRFIGGHPLAGAETSGVENARDDLFEGARWYLTPTQRTGGLLYDRVQRAVSEIGARPQAIEAETHDRLMATISHLPHVLANVLVTQAATALSEEAEHLHGLRVLVPNRPGIVAEVALELGRAGVNIEDMALYPAPDMTSGAISLYIAGDDEAERAEGLVKELGHDVSRAE